jgi:hypothetical protein
VSLDTLSSRLALADLKETEAKRRLVYVVGIQCQKTDFVPMMMHAVIKAIEIDRSPDFVVVLVFGNTDPWTKLPSEVYDTPEAADQELTRKCNDMREVAKAFGEAMVAVQPMTAANAGAAARKNFPYGFNT